MIDHYLMKCGHVALGRTANGRPACPICLGVIPGADEVDPSNPDLTGRIATCPCGKTRPSEYSLPFFEHRPHRDMDCYYCGCRGWD